MSQYVDLKLKSSESISEVFKNGLKDKLNLDANAFLETEEMLFRNTLPVLNKFNDKKSFLLFGDVQSGKTNNLIYLVSKLFEEDRVDVVFYLTGMTNDLLNQNQGRFFDTFEKLGPEFHIYRNKNIDPHEISIGAPKVIINSLKTSLRLKQMEEIIKKSSVKKRFLIIDDEADEASLSTLTKNLYKSLASKENVKFLSITATPFANLYKNQKFYDYFHVLKSAKGYCGINSFDNNIVIEENNKIAINKGLIEWLYSTATLQLKDSQYLINIFSKNDLQKQIFDYLDMDVIDKLKKYSVFKSNIEKRFPNYVDQIDDMYRILNSLNEGSIKISNGIFDDQVSNEGFEIIIGGIKLSRGITYRNLIVETMLNMGKSIQPGTLVQRARWFGYRKNINQMKIIVNEAIKEAIDEAKVLIEATKDYSLADQPYKKMYEELELDRIKI